MSYLNILYCIAKPNNYKTLTPSRIGKKNRHQNRDLILKPKFKNLFS